MGAGRVVELVRFRLFVCGGHYLETAPSVKHKTWSSVSRRLLEEQPSPGHCPAHAAIDHLDQLELAAAHHWLALEACIPLLELIVR